MIAERKLAAAVDERAVHACYRDAQRALEACAQVIAQRACLTPLGADYLGIG